MSSYCEPFVFINNGKGIADQPLIKKYAIFLFSSAVNLMQQG